MSKLDKDSVLEKFSKAYEAANGKAPNIEAKGGWYSVDGGKNVRLAQLDEMTDDLGSAKAPAKKKAPAAKKEAAPVEKAAPKKAAAKKAPAKAKAAKKPASAFSVKDFYTQQIQEANAGNRAPR